MVSGPVHPAQNEAQCRVLRMQLWQAKGAMGVCHTQECVTLRSVSHHRSVVTPRSVSRPGVCHVQECCHATKSLTTL